MTKKYIYAIEDFIGAKVLGKIHLRLLQESKKYELVGFYDPSIDNAKKSF